MISGHFKNIRTEILKTLETSSEEICVAVYWFTNHELLNQLCNKLEQGKLVSLVIHNDYINNRRTGLDFQRFVDLGGHLFFSDPDKPMHNKFCLVDRKVLINGSYNWTYYAEDRNNENILIVTDDSNVIEAFYSEFTNLTTSLKRVDKVLPLTTFEIDEYNGLSSREYLANDLIHEAKNTNRPELVQSAFQLSPSNIKIQIEAVKLNLRGKKRLKCSVGAGVKGDKYLVGVEKGTEIPITIDRVVKTSEDNQTDCSTSLYYGNNEVASSNKIMPRKSSNGRQGGLVIKGLPPKPLGESAMKIIFTIDINGILRVKLYSLDNGKSDYYSVDVNGILEETDNQI